MGIRPANFLAMRRALLALEGSGSPKLKDLTFLIDGRERIPDLPEITQMAVVGGDRKSRAVAAASILAKVNRDGYMRDAAAAFPGYGFEQHKGYGTKKHFAALLELGPCSLHRKSFAPVKDLVAIE